MGALLAIAGCASGNNAPIAAPSGALPDGLYRVLGRSPSPPGESRGVVRRYEPRRSDPSSDVGPEYVELDASDYVPLVLSRPPDPIPQPDGRIGLDLALAREHVGRLERVTKNNLGGAMAIVMDDEIMSVHKQRAVITDGRMKITRCTDRACERLLTKLVER